MPPMRCGRSDGRGGRSPARLRLDRPRGRRADDLVDAPARRSARRRRPQWHAGPRPRRNDSDAALVTWQSSSDATLCPTPSVCSWRWSALSEPAVRLAHPLAWQALSVPDTWATGRDRQMSRPVLAAHTRFGRLSAPRLPSGSKGAKRPLERLLDEGVRCRRTAKTHAVWTAWTSATWPTEEGRANTACESLATLESLRRNYRGLAVPSVSATRPNRT